MEGITPIQGDSIESMKFLHSCGVVPDVILVDGDHTYEYVLATLECIIELFGVPVIYPEKQDDEDSISSKKKEKGDVIYSIFGSGYEERHAGVKRAVWEISMKYNMPTYIDSESSWTYTPINRRNDRQVKWIHDVENQARFRQFNKVFQICGQAGDKLTMLKFILSKGNACYTVREYVNYFAKKSRKTWLMIAVDNGNINIVNNLINFYGADVNQANGERLTPLHIAAYKGHRNIALLLLKNGADRLMENKWGEKPAETARGKGNEELAQLIEKYNEEAWKYFSSTFHLAPIIKEKQEEKKKDDDDEDEEGQEEEEGNSNKMKKKQPSIKKKKKKSLKRKHVDASR